MQFSGTSPNGELVEIIELRDHRWFVGVQFHPEYKSRVRSVHPLFHGFVEAAKEYANGNRQLSFEPEALPLEEPVRPVDG